MLGELEEELENEYQLSNYKEEDKKREVVATSDTDGLTVKLIYEVQEEIGIKLTN